MIGELTFVEKLFQNGVASAIDGLIKDEPIAPVVVEIDPTTFCNLACPDCVNKAILNATAFSNERLMWHLENMKNSGISHIVFIGGGEPLCFPNFDNILRYCKSIGVSIGLVTNGVLVNRYIDSIADHISWVRFSVDASSKETYYLLKGKDCFDKVIRNIKILRNRSANKVGFSFLIIEQQTGGICSSNAHELLDAYKLAEELGCDYFEIKPSVDTEHNLIAYSVDTTHEVQDFLNAVPSIAKQRTRIIFPNSLRHILSGKQDQPKQYKTCHVAKLRCLLTPTGLFPCPYKRGLESYMIKSEALIDTNFWNSRERLDWIKEKLNPSYDCHFFCIRNQSNILLDTLLFLQSEGINITEHLIRTADEDLFL